MGAADKSAALSHWLKTSQNGFPFSPAHHIVCWPGFLVSHLILPQFQQAGTVIPTASIRKTKDPRITDT